MLSILLVDDERLVLDVLKAELPWEALNIGTVYTAQSAKQAMEVFAQHSVDILLCDIEMPQRSGLELLADLRDHQIDVVAALLTAHADFGYAREAVSLGALEYVTKPAPTEELARVIARCADEVARRRRTQDEAQKGRRWATSAAWLKHHFWLDVAAGRIPAHRTEMAAERQARCIEEPLEAEYMLLQMMLKLPSDDHSGLSESDLTRIVQDVVMATSRAEAVIVPMEHTWTAILPRDRWGDIDTACGMAREVMDTLVAHQQLFLMGCLVDNVKPEDIGDQIKRIYRRVHDRSDDARLLFFPAPLKAIGEGSARPVIEPAPFDSWRRMLIALQTEKVFAEVYGYLYRLNEGEPVSERVLSDFLQDFLQMVYTVLHTEGIHSAELYASDNVRALYSRAISGIDDLIVFCGQVMIRVPELLAKHRDQLSVSEQIRAYVAGHLSEELNRDIIAAHVGFSPEHVSRLFKQETGMNLVNYIQTERLNAACTLLISTELSVSDVAMQTGYDNFAYFSKAFRKFTGLSPSEYRRGRS